MKKNYPFILALLCALFFAFGTQAQDKFWGIFDTPHAGSLYTVNKDGSGYAALVNYDSAHYAGYSPGAIFRASDGTVYLINQHGPGWDNYGTLSRVSATGVPTVLHQFTYAEASNAHIAEGTDGFIYVVGPHPSAYSGYVFRCRPDGSNKDMTSFGKYGFNPLGDIVRASNGSLYALSYGGGNGFVYKIKTDFSGIETVYTFNKPTGIRPRGKLVEGPDGFLYGTTAAGGAYNHGVIFKVSLDGQQYVKLFDFQAGTSGKNPWFGLESDGGGNLYGTTTAGGQFNQGVIFKVSMQGTGFTVLHHFAGGVNGGAAHELLLDDLFLYGYARNSATQNDLLFRIKTDGTGYTKLLDLSGDGQGRLVRVPTAGQPLPYLVTPPNNETNASVNGWFRTKTIAGATSYTLQLSKTSDFAVVVAQQTSETRDFNISGIELSTTYYARVKSNLSSQYGIVTTFTTRSAESYAFVTKPADGSTTAPVVNLGVTANKVPYATHYTVEVNTASDFSGTSLVRTSTFSGERSFNFGNVPYATTYYTRVKTNLSPAYGPTTTFTTRQETFAAVMAPPPAAIPAMVPVNVEALEGARRYTLEVNEDQNFGGTSRILKSLSDGQTRFLVKDLAPETTYYARARSDISTTFGPTRSFTTRAVTGAWRLWGITTNGGTHDAGTIYSFSTDSLTFTKAHDYNSGEFGYYHLRGSLMQAPDGKFYGTAAEPGFTYGSDLFSFTPEGVYTPVDQGANYGASMLASDGKLYITNDDFYYWKGGIYYHDPSVSDWSSILERIIFRFVDSDWGGDPLSAVTEVGGYLYGVTESGGTYDVGTIYKLNVTGGEFQVLHHFDGGTGSNPSAAMIDGGDGFLYGMTPVGGPGGGVVFKIGADGTGFQVLHLFNGITGSHPRGSLVKVDQYLYGLTEDGGGTGGGVLFRVQTNGTNFAILHTFSASSGITPRGSLTLGKNGEFYSTTANGGSNGLGVLFKYSAGGGYQPLFHFTAESGSNPEGNLALAEDTYQPVATALAARTAPGAVFPNPFIDEFTTRVERKPGETVRLIITDLQGNVLSDQRTDSEEPIRMGSRLDRGIYLLKIIKGDQVSMHRLVKK